MKKILITILIFFTCNLSYGQLGASKAEVKAKYNSEPIQSGYTSDGYYFMGFKDNSVFNTYYYFSNNKDFCHLKKVDPIDQNDLQSIDDLLNTKFIKDSDTKWHQNKGSFRIVIEKVLYETGDGYYYEYSLRKIK